MTVQYGTSLLTKLQRDELQARLLQLLLRVSNVSYLSREVFSYAKPQLPRDGPEAESGL